MTAVDDGDLIECLDALASDRSEASRVAAVHPDHESHTGRVTRYELRDRTGVLHAVHVRVDGPSGKRMWWERPDGGSGLGMPLADVPLYGIHRLESSWCVAAEGEKATQALIDAGIPAVGTATGAAACPSRSVLGELGGVRVLPWPDHDDAGREHMRRVALGLIGVAASVRPIEPPADRPKGWDAAADALSEPGGRELAQALIDAAMSGPEFHVAQTTGSRAATISLPFRTAVEIAQLVPESRSWPCFPWLVSGGITELSGKVKASGKTTLAFAIADAVVRGQPFMSQPTIQSPVVILSEQPMTSLRVALGRAGLLERNDVEVLSWTEASGVPWKDVADAAVERCRVLGAGLLLVDTLAQFAGLRGDSENDSGAAMEAIAPLQAAAAAGVSVLVNRHDRKGGGEVGESARGSSAFAGAVDIVLRLSRPSGNQRPTIRKIESLSRFDETPPELLIELTPSGYVALGTDAAVASAEARDRILDALASEAEDGHAETDLLEDLELPRATIQRALKDLAADGLVERTGKGVKGDPYRWRPMGFVSALPRDEVRAESISWCPADMTAAGPDGATMVPGSVNRSAQTQTLVGADESRPSPPIDASTSDWPPPRTRLEERRFGPGLAIHAGPRTIRRVLGDQDDAPSDASSSTLSSPR